MDGWERELAPSAERLRAFGAGGIEWAQALEDARLDQEVRAVMVPVVIPPLPAAFDGVRALLAR